MSLFTQTTVSVMDRPKKKGRPRKDVITESVRLPADLLDKARHIALEKDLTLGEYLSQLIKGPLDRDWKVIRKQIGEKD